MDQGYDLKQGSRREVPDWSGANQTGLRQQNERLVLTLLRSEKGLAMAEIARRTGLSAQTVSRLIAALEADGMILRGDKQKGRVGQPSTPLFLNPEGAYFLGLKVGRRSVELVLTDFLGTILDREKEIYAYPDYERVLAFTLRSVGAISDRLGPPGARKLAGLGIAMPFHLWSWAPRIGVVPEHMAAWKTRDLRAEIAAALAMPVFLRNDATAASSAELVFGDAKTPGSFASFYIAFFIGGGLVLRRSVYTGVHGNAAGFGPLLVPDLQGQTRPLIDLASLAALEAAMAVRGLDTQVLWRGTEHWDIPPDILDPWAKEAGHALAHAILATQTVLDLEAFLIDGWLPRDVLAALTGWLREALEGLDMTGMTRPDILEGTLGADARPLGAASLPLTSRFLIT